jgi:hypothetical protein
MPQNPLDRVPRTGLWKVVIYEKDRLVRTHKDYIVIAEAERIANKLNSEFGNRKAAGAS